MGDDIAQIIMQTALASGIDPFLALAVAQQESRLNPGAVGDGGYSFGLYQENTAGGAGSTYLNNGGSYEDFFDPVSSTQRFADRVKYAMSQLGPDATPGEIAYAAQRPANRDAYIGAIDGLYQNAGGGTGGPKLLASLAGGTDNVSNDPGIYDPTLFGDTTDTGDGGGGAPSDSGGGNWWDPFLNWWNEHFGGGSTSGAPSPTDTAPPAGHGVPTVHSLGGGRVLLTYPDGTMEVKDYSSGTGDFAGTSLEQAAAKAGFYKFDEGAGYTPDVDAYVKFMAAKNAKAIAGSSGSSGSGIVNLGGGRYLQRNPDGTYTEKTFGGAGGANPLTPPSLDPTRASIVNYLRALLGQNNLPYVGVTPAQPTTPATTPATTPNTQGLTGPTPEIGTPPEITAGVTPPPAFSTPGTVNPTVPTLVTDPNIPQNATIAAPYDKQISLATTGAGAMSPDEFMRRLGR